VGKSAPLSGGLSDSKSSIPDRLPSQAGPRASGRLPPAEGASTSDPIPHRGDVTLVKGETGAKATIRLLGDLPFE
jgi:hypothetical protein